MNSNRWITIGVALILLINVSFTIFYFPTEPWFRWGELPSGIVMTLHDKALWEVISLIPSNASVLTQGLLLPYVTDRLNVYPAWRSDLQFVYILVDTTHFSYLVGPLAPPKVEGGREDKPFWIYEEVTGIELPDILSTGNYSLVTAVDGIWLLRKGPGTTVNMEKVITPDGHGLMATFYNNSEFIGNPVFHSVFLNLGPYTKLEQVWSTGWTLVPPFPTVKNSSFSAELSGYLYIPESGEFEFRSESYGNSLLLIDGNQVVMTGNDQVVKPVWLSEGYHEIKIYYTANTGEAGIILNWLTPWKKDWETIPGDYLYI